MDDEYSREISRINSFANGIRAKVEREASLHAQVAQIQMQLSNLPVDMVEGPDGTYDRNIEMRTMLQNDLQEAREQAEQATRECNALKAKVESMAGQYQQVVGRMREKAKTASAAAGTFGQLAGERFGGTTAGDGRDAAGQTARHYESYARMYEKLVEAARKATSGITTNAGDSGIEGRGTFQNPGGSNIDWTGNGGFTNGDWQGGSEETGDDGDTPPPGMRGAMGGPSLTWSGEPGNSVSHSGDKRVNALLNELNRDGVPFHDGEPNYDGISVASFPGDGGFFTPNAFDVTEGITPADIELAKHYGIPVEDAIALRRENQFGWAPGANGMVDLVPDSVGEECTRHLNVISGVFSHGKKEDFEANKRWNEEYMPLVRKNIESATHRVFTGFVTEEKLQEALNNIEFMGQKELGRRYGKGFKEGTLGFNDGSESNVARDIRFNTLDDSKLGIQGSGETKINLGFITAIHESIHMMSANDDAFTTRRGIMVGNDEKSRAMNEAFTEYFTFLACDGDKAGGGFYPGQYSGYHCIMREMPILERAVGRECMMDAYFNNKPERIRQAVDRILGPGSWDDMCCAAHQLLYSDSPYTSRDYLSHYLDRLERLAS